MSTATKRAVKGPAANGSCLYNGDRMTQPDFHRRYQAYPDHMKFELVEGVVYMASPLRRAHGKYHVLLAMLFGLYESETSGVEALDNATTILGEESEPQPDLALRILSAYGGRSSETKDDYVQGPPELIAEVAYSSRSMDMHQKWRDYRRAGVREYLVLCVEEAVLRWFRFKPDRELVADERGVYRSEEFPGLWIDSKAVLARNHARAARTLRKGLNSSNHAAFNRRLRMLGSRD
jgi:Uma2 family endonuclease